jgi:hypothetical protein
MMYEELNIKLVLMKSYSTEEYNPMMEALR